MAIETIKVSSRGQIVIPERIRKHLGIREGTTLVLVERGHGLFLEKEQDFLKELHTDKEKLGWLMLSEKSLAKLWDNPEDEVWNTYL